MNSMYVAQVRRAFLYALLIFIAVSDVRVTADDGSQTHPTTQEIPKSKQTTLGLYLTAAEAFAKWESDPEHLNVIDVRTPEEFIFIGHPQMAWNIPFATQTLEWDEAKQHFSMKPAPDFVSRVKEKFSPDDPLLVMCRSGTRSAMSVDALAKAGFTRVYNIIDGMEGDLVQDRENVYFGKRMKNGWKNSGVPWTYQIDPQKVVLPRQ